MRHHIISNGTLALLMVLALGWLYVDAQATAQPTREVLCDEILALRYEADPDPVRSTQHARDFTASISDAELALLHEFPARALRQWRPEISTASAGEVWSLMGIAELECGGVIWGPAPA